MKQEKVNNMKNSLQKIKIAVTGGIGSGKSMALQILGELGYSVFSCDEIYKNVIVSTEYVEIIKSAFPECVTNNQIDRKKLAEIIFPDKTKREKLNTIAHPFIMKQLFKGMEIAEGQLIFAEVPLLFEGKFEDNFDFVIIIQREKERRIESIKARDNISYQEIEKRLQAQIDYDAKKNIEYFKNKNYFILENNTKAEDLKNQLLSVVKFIQKTLL